MCPASARPPTWSTNTTRTNRHQSSAGGLHERPKTTSKQRTPYPNTTMATRHLLSPLLRHIVAYFPVFPSLFKHQSFLDSHFHCVLGRFPQICTMRYSVTLKYQKWNPLSKRKNDESPASICAKDDEKTLGPPPRPFNVFWRFILKTGMSHCNIFSKKMKKSHFRPWKACKINEKQFERKCSVIY